MRSKISGGKLVLCVLFIGLVVLVRYAARDLQLDADLLRESLTRMPGVVMEDIQMEREISGDLWGVRVPYLNREGNQISVRSLDVRRQLRDGGEWTFFGAEGVYWHGQQSATVQGLLGTLQTEDRTWNLESPKVHWSALSHEAIFPEGLTLYDQEFLLLTSEASMDEAGVVLLQEGGSIQWTKPLDD